MRLGTTPEHTFVFPFDISSIAQVKITYAQNRKVILEKYLVDCVVGTNSLTVSLTQDDTFLFVEGSNVEIQVRVLTKSKQAFTSDVYVVAATKCLDREVLGGET